MLVRGAELASGCPTSRMTQGQRKDAIERLQVQTMPTDRTFQHFFDEQMVSQSSGWSSGWCERMVSAEGCVR